MKQLEILGKFVCRLNDISIFVRLIRNLTDDQSSPELLVETAVILGSLAKGTDEHIKSLIDAGAIPALLNGKEFQIFLYIFCVFHAIIDYVLENLRHCLYLFIMVLFNRLVHNGNCII